MPDGTTRSAPAEPDVTLGAGGLIHLGGQPAEDALYGMVLASFTASLVAESHLVPMPPCPLASSRGR